MMRLPRILLNAATLLSLVLCAATMAAWVRSYRARDVVWWSLANPRMLVEVDTYRGGLTFGLFTPVFRDPIVPPGMGWEKHAPPVSFAEAGRPKGMLFNKYGMDDRQNGLGQWAHEAFDRFGVVLHLHQNGLYKTRELGRRSCRARGSPGGGDGRGVCACARASADTAATTAAPRPTAAQSAERCRPRKTRGPAGLDG
ncbi:MAG: hypothetical protein JWN40_81 [Phycisphaerales bacterium]|nr:hypothetical protein [Phycisphaerales bacterium]